MEWWSAAKRVWSAYSGLVPMSPNTTPSAPSVSAAPAALRAAPFFAPSEQTNAGRKNPLGSRVAAGLPACEEHPESSGRRTANRPFVGRQPALRLGFCSHARAGHLTRHVDQ